MNIIIYVDGGSRGNPGPAAAGVVIARDDGSVLHEAGYFLGQDTNNGAEYKALILALQYISDLPAEHVAIQSDSELLVRQITGEYRVKSPSLAKLHEQVQLLLLRLPRWHIRHVRREENRRADWLVNQALDRQQDVVVTDTDGRAAGAATEPGDDETQNSGASSAEGAAQPGSTVSGAGAANRDNSRTPAAVSDQRIVQVAIARRPNEGGCPVNAYPGAGFEVDATMPPGVCVYAAAAMLPTILAMRGTAGGDFAHVPAMTVRCGNPTCGAQFTLAPAIHRNGKPK